jgi:hypothetical protein
MTYLSGCKMREYKISNKGITAPASALLGYYAKGTRKGNLYIGRITKKVSTTVHAINEFFTLFIRMKNI